MNDIKESVFGRSGRSISIVGLGGEGVLRTTATKTRRTLLSKKRCSEGLRTLIAPGPMREARGTMGLSG